MDLKTCLAIVCLLGSALAVPVPQDDARDFIPDRYDVRGTLIKPDGSFSRQDPPEEPEQQLDQFGYGQQNPYQPQNDYPLANYGKQFFNNFQGPATGYPSQDQQVAFYGQYPSGITNDMNYSPRSENDDISQDDREDKAAEYYNQQQQQQLPQQQQDQPQNYQTYNDQPAAFSQPQEQSYFGQPQLQYQDQQYQQQFYQPQSELSDDMQGESRDKPAHEIGDNVSRDRLDEDDSVKKSEILRQRMKKFSIPKALSVNDREGMLGFQKQVYLRGGH